MFSAYVSGNLAGIGERCVRSAVCLYLDADSNFVIDWVDENVLLASPCSGHGFKHSAAIGETLVELALTRTSKIDTTFPHRQLMIGPLISNAMVAVSRGHERRVAILLNAVRVWSPSPFGLR